MVETLVVGAGPVGLAAALELARRGRSVRIVEKATALPEQSRALGVNPRSLDILEASGVAARIREESIHIHRAHLISRGRNIGTVSLAHGGHRHPFMCALPQARTATLLEVALAGHGVKVERGVEFISAHDAGEGVSVRLLNDAGRLEVDADYLLGCDGAQSDVRDDAGIDFVGETTEHGWTLLDAEVDWPFDADAACLVFSERGNLFVLPVVPGVWRFVATSETPEDLLPEGVALGKVLWRSRFRLSHKIAASMRKGNVFLAGDSAHIHSPAGARGMNGGIEDAATYAWLAEQGQLGRYDGLRRPRAEQVIRQVDRQTRQAQARGAAIVRIREIAARLALPLPFVQRYAALFVTGQDTPEPEWLAQGASER